MPRRRPARGRRASFQPQLFRTQVEPPRPRRQTTRGRCTRQQAELDRRAPPLFLETLTCPPKGLYGAPAVSFLQEGDQKCAELFSLFAVARLPVARPPGSSREAHLTGSTAVGASPEEVIVHRRWKT